MNYYQARELKNPDGAPAGIWHYTCQNDNRIWPVGHCANGCPGHATAEEAEEHYRQYLLDTARYGQRLGGDVHRPCRACGALTQGCVTTEAGTSIYVLCEAHQTRAHLDPLVKRPAQIISSW